MVAGYATALLVLRRSSLGKIAHILLKTEFPKPLAEIEQEVRDSGQWRGELEDTRATSEPPAREGNVPCKAQKTAAQRYIASSRR